MEWGNELVDEDKDIEDMSPLERLAPDAITGEEASELEQKWRILVWGQPGMGKTHFSFTMPEPICFIDTERKSEAIIDKFQDKEIFLWQPRNWDEAKEALDQSIDVLDHFLAEEDQRGTIVVDSMSNMWELSQQKHVQEHYPGKTVDEVEFQSAFGSGQGDWKIIKRYHNNKFRDVMVETDYHVCWTGMSKEDYNEKMSEGLDFTPMKAAGESKNVYAVSDIIRVLETDDGKPAGTLEKSSLTKHRYRNLEYPTFDKHREIVQAIKEVESNDGDPAEELEYDVTIQEGMPKYAGDKE